MIGERKNHPIEDRLAEEAAAARVRDLERENAKLREVVTRAIEQFHAFGWPAVDLENALKK